MDELEQNLSSQSNFQLALPSWEGRDVPWVQYNQFADSDYANYLTPESQRHDPMLSHGPPDVGEGSGGGKSVSVSTAFCPGVHPLEPNLLMVSSDGVLFYVHSNIILSASPDAFSSTLLTPSIGKGALPLVEIPENSVTLNIILHTLYGTSCAQNAPSFEDLSNAIDRMPQHWISPKKQITPETPLYNLLLSYAPLRPIHVYALAAHHDLTELAEKASSHLLGFPLATIDDGTSKKIGPVYLKRLFLLHAHRLTALKNLLLQPPGPHAATNVCNFEDQKRLTRAWALASSYLVWDAKPDLSGHSIQTAFNRLSKDLTCKDCQDCLKKRVREVAVGWAATKCTI